MISTITNGKAKIKTLQKDLRSIEAFDELKQVDFIFGCVDNDGARLILNQLAISYLIHYIDCATGINVANNKIEIAGGHVMVVQPDGPCMESCTNFLDLKEVADNLTSKEEFENRKKLGYINNVNIKDPSVVSLNGTIASLATTKFMKLVTNLGSVSTLTIYDLLEEDKPSVVPRHLTINEKCVHHRFIGIGDKIHLERYLKKEKITLR